MSSSCKKDAVPSSPGQPALSKIIKDGALETEFLYESGKGLVRINYYDSETGQLSSFNKFDYDTKGLLQSYSAHNASGKITSEKTHLKGSDGKFNNSDIKILTGTDSCKENLRDRKN